MMRVSTPCFTSSNADLHPKYGLMQAITEESQPLEIGREHGSMNVLTRHINGVVLFKCIIWQLQLRGSHCAIEEWVWCTVRAARQTRGSH